MTAMGPAAEHQGGKLGLYLRAGQHNGKPFYKQLHTVPTQHDWFLYADDKGWWWVSASFGGTQPQLMSNSSNGSVPVSGWQYFSRDNRWHHDPDFRMTPITDISSVICSSINITLDGGARRNHDHGTFTFSGDFSCGRPVFHNTSTGRYLMVSAGKLTWSTKASVTACGGGIRSGCAPGFLCPAHPCDQYRHGHGHQQHWQYADINNNGNNCSGIEVKCTTHFYGVEKEDSVCLLM